MTFKFLYLHCSHGRLELLRKHFESFIWNKDKRIMSPITVKRVQCFSLSEMYKVYCVFEFLHSVQDTVNMKAIRILQFISLVKIIFVLHLIIKKVTIIFIVNMIVGVKCSFFLHQSLKLLKCEASKILFNFYSNNWYLTHHHQHLPVPAAPSHVLCSPSLISS